MKTNTSKIRIGICDDRQEAVLALQKYIEDGMQGRGKTEKSGHSTDTQNMR